MSQSPNNLHSISTTSKQQNIKKQSPSKENDKYQEIIELNPIHHEMKLNMNEIADYLIDLEYNIHKNKVDPCITLQNINFILSCYIWYYIKDDQNWTFIQPLTDSEKQRAQQWLISTHYDYKSSHYFQQQSGFKNTIHRIPKSLCIGSTVGVISSIGAMTFCIGGTMKLISANIDNSVEIFKTAKECDAKDTLLKLPSIPLGICASIIIGGVVGATAIIAIPTVTLGSVAVYLVNGTDLTDAETWQYIGAAKLNMDHLNTAASFVDTDNDTVIVN